MWTFKQGLPLLPQRPRGGQVPSRPRSASGVLPLRHCARGHAEHLPGCVRSAVHRAERHRNLAPGRDGVPGVHETNMKFHRGHNTHDYQICLFTTKLPGNSLLLFEVPTFSSLTSFHY